MVKILISIVKWQFNFPAKGNCIVCAVCVHVIRQKLCFRMMRASWSQHIPAQSKWTVKIRRFLFVLFRSTRFSKMSVDNLIELRLMIYHTSISLVWIRLHNLYTSRLKYNSAHFNRSGVETGLTRGNQINVKFNTLRPRQNGRKCMDGNKDFTELCSQGSS